MSTNRFGEVKGPLLVWMSVTLYFALISALGRTSGRALPKNFTWSLVPGLLTGIATSYGVVLVFLIIFLRFWEGNKSFMSILWSIGLKAKGSFKSVIWSFALSPAMFLVGLILMLFQFILGPMPTPVPFEGVTPPRWYVYYMIGHSFFPVSVIEEGFARGYMLDRLIPRHPSNIAEAFPAVLLSSILFTLYHLPPYLMLYNLPTTWIFLLLTGNVFLISVVLGVAYVRSRSRNILGVILMHFLADSGFLILSLI